MWTDSISFELLSKKSCWKVEFFCGETLSTDQAAFEMVSLKDLVSERRETVDPQATPAEVLNYLGLENVESLTGNLVGFSPKLGKEIRSRSKVFKPGDVLYGRLRPYLNKVYLASEPVRSGICSGEFFVLIPQTKKVLPHFLRALLTSKFIHQYVSRRQTGSALPRLQLNHLLELEVPVPPLEIQREFEHFLIQRTAYQRRLAAELASLPQQTVDTVVEVLTNGTDSISNYIRSNGTSLH
jgi:restriction endonuclease S subunit